MAPRLGVRLPVGAEHEQPGRLVAAGDSIEKSESRMVGPVQVVENEHERRGGRKGFQRLHHLSQHGVTRRAHRPGAQGHELVSTHEPRHLPEPGRSALVEDVDHRLAARLPAQTAERVEDRHVRLALAAPLDAATVGDAKLGAARPHPRGVR